MSLRPLVNALPKHRPGETAEPKSRHVFFRRKAIALVCLSACMFLSGNLHSEENAADALYIDSNGRVGIGTNQPRSALDTATGVMSGAANDYQKAQFVMSGGGRVTWSAPGNRLKWNRRFIAISMERSKTFAAGHVNILQPTSDIPAADVYDGKSRSANADGIVLNPWEALYAVHTVGGDQSAVSFRIVNYTHEFNAPSNWLLVAVVNGDDKTVKLGTGTIISANSSSNNGSPLPSGTIVMWSGPLAGIPDGWALCNGQNGTPDLQDRFIRGVKTGENPGPTGGSETHSHVVNGHTHTLPKTTGNTSGGGGYVAFGRNAGLTGNHSHPLGGNTGASAPGTNAQNHLPPFFKLAFIMKL
jgi:hypothetical protein